MKKLLIFPLMLVLILGLAGCSTLEIGSIENNTSSKMTGSYTMLSGTKEHRLTVKDGEPVDVSVDIVTKSGKIDIFIFKDKDNYEYEGHDVKTSDFSVALSDPGKYTIRVKAHKHKGSYSFKW